MSNGQILLKRNPTFNDKNNDFYASWENEHGQQALPWALATGVTYYAQVGFKIPVFCALLQAHSKNIHPVMLSQICHKSHEIGADDVPKDTLHSVQ